MLKDQKKKSRKVLSIGGTSMHYDYLEAIKHMRNIERNKGIEARINQKAKKTKKRKRKGGTNK